MYKVYVNGVPFYIGTPDSTGDLGLILDKNAYNAPYLGKRKQIKQFLDLINKNKNVSAVVLYADNAEALWADFQSCFKILEAAGGYVLNSDQQLLVFLRRGSWDMPKGKIDKGETPEQAAVREVNEETGLQHIELGAFLTETWHTYTQKEERILKRTYWYAMRTPDTQVVPQTEEDIERIEWVNPQEWVATQPVVYRSILDVVEKGMKAL